MVMILPRILAVVCAVSLTWYAAVKGENYVHCCDPDVFIMDLVSGFSQETGEEYAAIVTGAIAQDRPNKLAATVTHYTDVTGKVTTKHEIYDLSEPARLWTITDGKHCSLERNWKLNHGCVEDFMDPLPSVTYGKDANQLTVDRYGFSLSGEDYFYHSIATVTKDGCLPFSNVDVVYEADEHVSVSKFHYGNYRAVQPDSEEWFTVPSVCPQELPEGTFYIESD